MKIFLLIDYTIKTQRCMKLEPKRLYCMIFPVITALVFLFNIVFIEVTFADRVNLFRQKVTLLRPLATDENSYRLPVPKEKVTRVLDKVYKPVYSFEELNKRIEEVRRDLGLLDTKLTLSQQHGLVSLAKATLRHPLQYHFILEEARKYLAGAIFDSTGVPRLPTIWERIKLRPIKRALKRVLGVDISGCVYIVPRMSEEIESERGFLAGACDSWMGQLYLCPEMLISFWVTFEEGVHLAASLSGGGFHTHWLEESCVQSLKRHLVEDRRKYHLPERRELTDLMAHPDLVEFEEILEEAIGWEPIALTYFTGDERFIIEALGPNGIQTYQLIETFEEILKMKIVIGSKENLLRMILNNRFSKKNLDIIAKMIQWMYHYNEICEGRLLSQKDLCAMEEYTIEKISQWLVPYEISASEWIKGTASPESLAKLQRTIASDKVEELRHQLEVVSPSPGYHWIQGAISPDCLNALETIVSTTTNRYLSQLAKCVLYANAQPKNAQPVSIDQKLKKPILSSI